jgi:hypothetical protein
LCSGHGIRSKATDVTIDPKVQKQIDRFFKKHSVTRVGLSVSNMGCRREEGKAIELDIHDWSKVLLALCGTRAREKAVCKHSLGIARRIADHLAEALGIDAPSLRT